MIRHLFTLARISNLPTVWSNVIAAWLIGGGTLLSPVLAAVMAGASLIYAAGCTLNDALDARWDAQHRPDRVIPSGGMSLRAVWLAGVLEMLAGLACIIAAAPGTVLSALTLAACILLYDSWHKQSPLSVIIMGACRWLLYAVAGAAAGNILPAMAGGAVVWLYIIVLSLIARGEATRAEHTPRSRWLILLIPVSLVILAAVAHGSGSLQIPSWDNLPSSASRWRYWLLLLSPALAFGLMAAILVTTLLPRPVKPGPAVNLMLASIPLLDGCVLAALTGWHPALALSVAGFLLARAMQRWFSAT